MDNSLRRLNLLKGHVQPSEDAKREQATATFSLAYAQEKVWDTLPEGYYDSIE